MADGTHATAHPRAHARAHAQAHARAHARSTVLCQSLAAVRRAGLCRPHLLHGGRVLQEVQRVVLAVRARHAPRAGHAKPDTDGAWAGTGTCSGTHTPRLLGWREHEAHPLLGLQWSRVRCCNPAAVGQTQVRLAGRLRPAGPRRLWRCSVRGVDVADRGCLRRPLRTHGPRRRLLRRRLERRRRGGLRQVCPRAEPRCDAPGVDGRGDEEEPMSSLDERLRRW
mmetsp:Transcript_81324/g.256453  ORF Transcript_81324/g.256453 Transcript_81324/m.256453 type:complete len:224 (-) Transcript_81324:508-1179(-)